MKGHRLILIAAAGLSFPVLAHHSDSIYDRDTLVAGEGVVTRYSFRNPHVLISVELQNEAGETTEWLVETGASPIMTRSGWSADLLSPGDVVTVRMHPERSGRPHAILNTLQTADGEIYRQVEEEAEETVAAESLHGVYRGARQPSLFAQMRELELTPAAIAAREAYQAAGRDPSTECDPIAPPFAIASLLYMSGIEVMEDRVLLKAEFLDSNRTVWLNLDEHPADTEYSFMGHSIGRWDGEDLVVDTRYFEENPVGNGRGGVPSSRQKHLVERYALSDDRRRVEVTFTLEDPEYIAEPFEGRVEMIYTPHLEMHAYNCIPGTLD